MARLHYATHLNTTNSNLFHRIVTYSITDWRVSAYSLILVSFFLIVLSSRSHGDEFTGLSHDDPKDLGPASAPASSAPPANPSCDPFAPAPADSFFAPLPAWAHGATMPALPYQLTPMGKKPAEVAATTTGTAPESLAPPKEATQVPLVSIPGPAPKPAPAPEPPALIAVSPFLQWVKSNPQAAAAEARQQAASENTAQAPTGPTTATSAPVPAANQVAPTSASPYWLPPLIDSGEFGGSPGGSSAAIYMTPQR
jgi:hypothetical protein